jgi:hypothetical protein
MKNLIITLLLVGLFPVIAASQPHAKGAATQSSDHVDTTTVDTSLCGFLFGEGYWAIEDGREPDGYDTLRMYMEDCPLDPDASDYFSSVLGGAQTSIAIEPGTYTYPGFLAWLKKVLYYNPDTNWYCNDVSDMITAVQSAPAEEAICQYIITSGKCPNLVASFEESYNSASRGRYTAWLDSIEESYQYLGWIYSHHDSIEKANPEGIFLIRDSINADTLAHPYDSTVPSLQQDSLEILLGPQFSGVQPVQTLTSEALLDAPLLENPMTNEIDIAFEMGRTALVTMQLSDVLGRNVPLTYAKYQLEQPGQHDASIPAPNLPPGTYYLRITTDVGDAITLKVVKE